MARESSEADAGTESPVFGPCGLGREEMPNGLEDKHICLIPGAAKKEIWLK